MKDSELNALISLLDDDDPGVKTHVRDKLIELGQPVIHKLEAKWENLEDEYVQQRIEEIIHSIQSRDTILALREWRNSGGGNLLKGWYLLSKYQYPDLDFEPYKAQISRLANTIWLDMRAGMTLPERLKTVNNALFVREKYRANRRSILDPGNNFLNTLLDSKKGSPLSLGMLYLVLCDELELPIQGLMLPDYFVLMYRDESKEFYIDPFKKGGFFRRKDLETYLKEKNVEDMSLYDRPSSNIFIILTTVQLLIEGYRWKKQPEKVSELRQLLEYLDLEQDFP
jgi:hypothetical protein